MSEIPDDIMAEAESMSNNINYVCTDPAAVTKAIAEAIDQAVTAERERIVRLISDQGVAMAEMALHGLPEQSRLREAMESALTQIANIIRVAKIGAPADFTTRDPTIARLLAILEKVPGALNASFNAGMEECEGGSWRRQEKYLQAANDVRDLVRAALEPKP